MKVPVRYDFPDVALQHSEKASQLRSIALGVGHSLTNKAWYYPKEVSKSLIFVSTLKMNYSFTFQPKSVPTGDRHQLVLTSARVDQLLLWVLEKASWGETCQSLVIICTYLV